MLLFLQNVFQHEDIQRLLCDQSLELLIFFFKRLQTPGLPPEGQTLHYCRTNRGEQVREGQIKLQARRSEKSYCSMTCCTISLRCAAGEGHCERKVIYEVIGQQKAPDRMDWGLSIITSLTMTYFHTGCSTIIGAKSFHGPVRDGKGWYQLAIVIRHNL